MRNWEAYATIAPTVTTSPPAPTNSGTTGSCYEWHTVVSGDTCSVIETAYGITDADFRNWNPSIDANCYNLILGDA